MKNKSDILRYMMRSSFSLEEITKLGERVYFENFKDLLEKDHMGQYVVIDVEQKKYQIDPDRLAAVAYQRRIREEASV